MAIRSRITFAIGDLVAEIKNLMPGVEAPYIELQLAPETFDAVVGEIESYYGQKLTANQFAGLVLVKKPIVKLDAA
jgi:hypothetical protein